MNTNETIYETYARVICKECNNRYNQKDLCEIKRTQDNKAICYSYLRCMQNKCNTCKDNKKCLEEEEYKNETRNRRYMGYNNSKNRNS